MEKIPIFDQNHGLTPLQKFEFCHFLKRHFYVKEYLLFYLEYQQIIFLGLFCPNTNYGKKSKFLTKAIAKMTIFRLFELLVFIG